MVEETDITFHMRISRRLWRVGNVDLLLAVASFQLYCILFYDFLDLLLELQRFGFRYGGEVEYLYYYWN